MDNVNYLITLVTNCLNYRGLNQTQGQDLSEGCYYSTPNEQHFQQLIHSGFPVITKDDYLEFLAQRISPDLPRLLKDHFNNLPELNHSVSI